MTKSIQKLGPIDTDTTIINEQKKTLGNGTTIHTSTIQRDKPIPAAR